MSIKHTEVPLAGCTTLCRRNHIGPGVVTLLHLRPFYRTQLSKWPVVDEPGKRDMSRQWTAALLLALATLGGSRELAAQNIQVGIIDFYGLHHVSETEARSALAVKEGDTISVADDARPALMAQSEQQLSRLRGVLSARVNLVCCDRGRGIIYVGVEEKGGATHHFRKAPRGDARLAADVVDAGKEFDRALTPAARRGDAEDRSQGHALLQDPSARAVQERFIGFAARDLKQLRNVLRRSSDSEHRALAAQVLGYAADKQAVVDDLVYAMSDSAEGVRNNAMRALGVFVSGESSVSQKRIVIPPEPFVSLLNSVAWTDKNKASLALMKLSERRDLQLLQKLQKEAIVPLVEMARWKTEGHAWPAFLILGRIADQSDDAIQAAWTHGQREVVINAAVNHR